MKKAATFTIGLSVIGLLTGATGAFSRYGGEEERNQCHYNLRCIDSAKRLWAFDTIRKTNPTLSGIGFEIIETNQIAGKIPTVKEIGAYLNVDIMPRCPSGGTYTMGRVLDPPTCSFHDHDILRGPIGFVTEEDRGRRMEGATVVLTDDSGKHWTNTTNPKGGATFNTWPNEAVSVVISKDGYLTASGKVPLPNGTAGTETVTLHKK